MVKALLFFDQSPSNMKARKKKKNKNKSCNFIESINFVCVPDMFGEIIDGTEVHWTIEYGVSTSTS